jgi:hypothetical protein
MKATRILAALAAAGALFMASVQSVNADEGTKADMPTVTVDLRSNDYKVPELKQGEPFTAQVLCPSDYKQFQLRLGDKLVGTGSLEQGAQGVKIQPTAEQVGEQALSALCTGYNGQDKTGVAKLNIKSTRLLVSPTSWKAGDEVTLTGYGFTPGEAVSLDLVRDADGKSHWSAASVATADPNGVFVHKIVLKSDVPLGNYTLTAKGDKSDLALELKFYWGRPDADNKAPGKSAPGAGGGQAAKKVGLPKTGA